MDDEGKGASERSTCRSSLSLFHPHPPSTVRHSRRSFRPEDVGRGWKTRPEDVETEGTTHGGRKEDGTSERRERETDEGRSERTTVEEKEEPDVVIERWIMKGQ